MFHQMGPAQKVARLYVLLVDFLAILLLLQLEQELQETAVMTECQGVPTSEIQHVRSSCLWKINKTFVELFVCLHITLESDGSTNISKARQTLEMPSNETDLSEVATPSACEFVN